MSDNNVLKGGVGLLAILSLMFTRTCKTCEHESSSIIKNVREIEVAKEVKPSRGFSCNARGINDASASVVEDEIKNIRNEDEVFLKKINKNEFSYTDRTPGIFNSLNDLQIDDNKTFIVDGNLEEDEIKVLNKKGVNFICNKEVYEKQKDIVRYEILFIFSEDREILKDLYSINDDQVDEVIKIAQPLLTDIYVTKIASKESLDETLKRFREHDIVPVIIFNNKNKTLFDHPLSYYNVSNAITCNSYNLGSPLFFSSTDYLGFNNVVKSLVNNEPQPTLFDFYKNFSNNYATQLYNDKKYFATVVSTGVAVTGGGAGYIIYYNINEKS
ncbi:MAG: hypothetical protein QM763_15000 [Agriterribacter sp.]